MRPTRKRHLRNLFINPSLQLRYTLTTTVLCVAILVAVGVFWFRELKVASDILEVNVISTLRAADGQRIRDDMAAENRLRLAVMAGSGLLICALVVGFSILLSHRVAGPLFVINRNLDLIRDETLPCKAHFDPAAAAKLEAQGGPGQGPCHRLLRPLRAGDQLADTYEHLRDMVQVLREHAEEDLRLLEKTIALLEKTDGASDTGPVLEALKARRDRLRASVGCSFA